VLIATIRLPFAVVDSGGWRRIAPSVPQKYDREGHTSFSVVPPPARPWVPAMPTFFRLACRSRSAPFDYG